MCGFFDKEKKEITILIYNFGPTIAETLSQDNLPNHVQTALNQVIENHTKRAYWVGKKFTQENALTLMAIQEGISSKLDQDKSRGHGITDFIEHCMDLNTNSKIAIISGKSAIKIDSTYKISSKDVLVSCQHKTVG